MTPGGLGGVCCSVALSWPPASPAEGTAEAVSYELDKAEGEGNTEGAFKLEYSGAACSATVAHLKPATRYRCVFRPEQDSGVCTSEALTGLTPSTLAEIPVELVSQVPRALQRRHGSRDRRARREHEREHARCPGSGGCEGHGDKAGRGACLHHEPGKGSLGDAESSLGDAESSLGDAMSSLGEAKSSLGDAEGSLGDAESSLGDAKSSLGDAESSLGDAESSLGVAKSALYDAQSSLGDAEISLGDAKISLGGTKSSLSGTKSPLGHAKSSLGDAESSLGDAKISVIDSPPPVSPSLWCCRPRLSRIARPRWCWRPATPRRRSQSRRPSRRALRPRARYSGCCSSRSASGC